MIGVPLALNFLSTAKFDGYDEYDFGITSVKVKDLYKSTFFSVPVGVSYEFNSFVFDARYNFGLGKVHDSKDGSYSALTFTVGYKF